MSGLGAAVLVVAGVMMAGRAAPAAGRTADSVAIWAVDPLVKVFRDAQPATGTEALAEVARGEVATLHIVVRSDAAIQRLTARVGSLACGDARLGGVRVRYVGYVPVSVGQGRPSADRIRVPPAEFPDPLLPVKSVDVAAGQAQPIWLTVPIPLDAQPGTYTGELRVTGQSGGKRVQATMPIAIKVYAARVGRGRLWVDNWFFVKATKGYPAPAANTPEYWTYLRRVARNLAEHRQNVALIPAFQLARFDIDDAGTVKVDFSEFDKWVRLFIQAGVIGRIDGGGNGTRIDGWTGPYRAIVKAKEAGKIVDKVLPPDDPQVHRFMSQYLPQLVKHLKAKGWFDKFLYQVGDEPCDENSDTFNALSAVVAKYAPGLKRMDACCGLKFDHALDVFVPEIDFLHPNFDYFKGLQKGGAELWMYTCCHPEGEYLNRFVELPLIKTRLMHWMNYRYGTTGYLHWGYNYWPLEDNPYTDAVFHEGGTRLVAGDAWIVYPGKDGPVDSIRWEAMRDGLADHELLCIAAEKGGDSMALAERHILAFDRYDTDIATFRATRRELLEAAGE